MEQKTPTPPEVKKTLIIAGIATILLLAAVFMAYRYAKRRTATIVLPGGTTYLGPSVAPTLPPDAATISIPSDATWGVHRGKTFPYSFSYPTTLSLGVFPNDPFDSVTIFWGNTNPQENILLRVENLTTIPDGERYTKESKKEYAQIWWKQYSSWKGVADISEFTNRQGIKGYRAKYLDTSGMTPFDNIFFEVPGRPELVIWMASRLIEQSVFDRIVESVDWQKNATP